MASVQKMKTELQALIDQAVHSALFAGSTVHDSTVKVAAETGRLDLVTVILASITVILALGGMVAFFEIRQEAKGIAERVAREESRAIAEAIVLDYANNALPVQVREHVENLVPQHGNLGAPSGPEAETEGKRGDPG